jgi:hypothetical protein
MFLDITHYYYLKRFGDQILCPSSGKNLLSWEQSIEVDPPSGDRG